MSGDETFVLIVAGFFGPVSWWLWLIKIRDLAVLRRPATFARTAATLLVAMSVVITVVLRVGAASDVRNDAGYLFMYLLLGLAWLRGVHALLPFGGVSLQDDGLERGNAAVPPLWAGALIGGACCYCGANIGEGPGWPVVVFSAALATAAVAGVWLLMAEAAGVIDVIAIERDRATGWRFGGLLVACGLIFGRAVAGDWVSLAATLTDFVLRAWPALPLLALAVAIDRVTRPTLQQPHRPVIAAGVMPAIAYVLIAAGAVAWTIWR